MYPPIFVDPSLYGYNPPSVYTFQPHRGHNAGAYMARQRMMQREYGGRDRLRYKRVRDNSYENEMQGEPRRRAARQLVDQQQRQLPEPNMLRMMLLQRAMSGERPDVPSPPSLYLQRRPNQRMPTTAQPFAQTLVR